ncbi:competence protein ComK [Robertmurraya korlensis]|uniref:competence protein ComK n=1 Tax=Robertmurraya korlensis TaxID=519977 RepID=UPI0008247635|nr:competence protein ComK [Robertmurraya korlensis]
MLLLECYMVNQRTLYMYGFYDRNGKRCTVVKEIDKTFTVDKAPLHILEDSIKCIGYDLKGAMASAKWILGNIHMPPVMINPIQSTCLFPDKSAKNADTIWFNPAHIVLTTSYKKKTYIEFTDGTTLIIHCTISAFNTKLQNAMQLRNITTEMGKNPKSMSMILDPSRRKPKKRKK